MDARTDIHAFLAQHEQRDLLRFLTCGSVDDGKSTLIGRLLYDSKLLYDDQLDAVTRDSARYGTTGGGFDPALVTDGLKAEREQGITIDVAYRYFSTARRKFIIADTPGHEQYTRNMATGASTCHLAIILVDARKGVLTQTRRHSFIAALLGIQHVIVAVNKMDLVEFREDAFEAIHRDYTALAARLELKDVRFIPIAALHGDNVVEPSRRMPWYQGSTLMHILENVHIASDRNLIDFRFPVQFVNRPSADFRGYCGTIASGVLRRGDEVLALPSRKTGRVQSIVTHDGELQEAFAPQAVTVTLNREIDVSRGDMLVRPANVPHVDERFDAMIVWMSETPLEQGRRYVIKHTTRSILGAVTAVRYRINVNTLHREPAEGLALNEIGRCEVSLNQPVAWDPYSRNRATGAFIVIDRVTHGTVGAGMILDRAAEPTETQRWHGEPPTRGGPPQPGGLAPDEKAARFHQRPATVLLTGLTGAGKTTIALAVERRLLAFGHACVVLDGRNLRSGISRDLGFSARDRSESLRRGAEIARLVNEAGLICIAAFVAPDERTRQLARELIGAERFLLVHLDAPLDVCRARDRTGLYAAAESGDLANVPGISFAYERPAAADLTLETDETSIESCVEKIVGLLRSRGCISKE